MDYYSNNINVQSMKFLFFLWVSYGIKMNEFFVKIQLNSV